METSVYARVLKPACAKSVRAFRVLKPACTKSVRAFRVLKLDTIQKKKTVESSWLTGFSLLVGCVESRTVRQICICDTVI